MDPAGGPRRRRPRVPPEFAVGKGLVAGEDVELAGGLAAVGVGRVVPAARIGVAAELDRVVRRAAHAGAADVDGDHAVVPVGAESDAVDDPDVVDRVSGRVELEASDAVGLGRILDADHVEAPAVRQGVDVLLVDEHVVDPAPQLVVEPGQDAHAYLGLRDVENDEAVLAVRGALAADHGDPAVFRDLDVVYRPGVDAHRVDEHDALRVRHVPDVGVALGAPGAGDRVVPGVRTLPDPEVGGTAVAHLALAHELDLLVHAARASPGPARWQSGCRPARSRCRSLSARRRRRRPARSGRWRRGRGSRSPTGRPPGSGWAGPRPRCRRRRGRRPRTRRRRPCAPPRQRRSARCAASGSVRPGCRPGRSRPRRSRSGSPCRAPGGPDLRIRPAPRRLRSTSSRRRRRCRARRP